MAAFLLVPSTGFSQACGPRAGQAGVYLSYSYLDVGDHLFSVDTNSKGDTLGFNRDLGDIRAQTVFLGADFGITDRLTARGDIAFVTARYKGPKPENEIDDGSWNGSFQNFNFGVRYRFLDSPFVVTPSFAVTIPSHSYDILGHAAIGRGLNEARLGAAVGWLPLKNSYLQARYQYAFVEEIEIEGSENVNTNRSNVSLQVGYFLKTKWSFRAIGAYAHAHGGIVWGVSITKENKHVHDQGSQTRAGSIGLGVAYAISPLVAVDIGGSKVLWGESTHDGYSIALGTSWNFDLPFSRFR